MLKQGRGLPSLDLLKGFEAAARNLSFTKAAAELFVTQSAVSRQIKTLEEQLGVALFRRQHRELRLTEQGQTFYKTSGEVLRLLRDATGRLAKGAGGVLTVTTMVSFASLWLVPRLNDFRRLHPQIEVRISAASEFKDLEREGIDVAIRYCVPRAAGPGALRLFGERVFPVCSPALLLGGELKSPRDIQRMVLLHYEEADRSFPWLSWNVWLDLVRAQDVRPAGTLRFSHYDQVIQAALEGQGVALGRSPLVARWLKDGKLVLPFGKRYTSSPSDSRAYFIVTARTSAARPEAVAFSTWLQDQARAAAE